MKNKHNYSIITGGLGNQLFQFGFSISKTKGAPLILETSIGKPRETLDGNPEINEYILPKNVTLLKRNRTELIRKVFGYTLRSRIAPQKIEKFHIYLRVLLKIEEICFSIFFKSRLNLIAPKTVGFEDIEISKRRSNIFIGYFQSYQWVTEKETLNILRKLSLKNPSSNLQELSRRALVEKPLVVHIRLGDYKKEDSFGLLSKDYYEGAIREILKDGKCKSIWVFSDEPEIAKSHFPEGFVEITKWISEVQSSTSETLEAMRLGHGYVIGNSTFSWWGAYLTHNLGAKVIAPKPWFKSMDTPPGLIPPEWEQKTAIHVKN
jgi:hypothetical protein